MRVVEPYFERSYDQFSGHQYTPPAKASRYAAAVRKGVETLESIYSPG